MVTDVRSRIMSSVKRQNTGPEVRVRKLLHAMGYRFRLHKKELPGTPDIALSRYKAAIFVHGCFWHQHRGCKYSRRPSSNISYWNKKLDANIERDRKNIKELVKLGWKVLILWQCEIKDAEAIKRKIDFFLIKQ